MSLTSLCGSIDLKFKEVETEFEVRQIISGHEIFNLLEDKMSDQLWVYINGAPIFSMHLDEDPTLYSYVGLHPIVSCNFYFGTNIDVSYRPFSFKTM